jgi:hypothetical protein
VLTKDSSLSSRWSEAREYSNLLRECKSAPRTSEQEICTDCRNTAPVNKSSLSPIFKIQDLLDTDAPEEERTALKSKTAELLKARLDKAIKEAKTPAEKKALEGIAQNPRFNQYLAALEKHYAGKTPESIQKDYDQALKEAVKDQAASQRTKDDPRDLEQKQELSDAENADGAAALKDGITVDASKVTKGNKVWTAPLQLEGFPGSSMTG